MGASEKEVTVRVLIEGRVQGVWFRAWTREAALSLGLRGWVRNRRDGSVEAVFAGLAGGVADMIARCHDGPPSATVSRITKYAASAGDLAGHSGFDLRTSP